MTLIVTEATIFFRHRRHLIVRLGLPSFNATWIKRLIVAVDKNVLKSYHGIHTDLFRNKLSVKRRRNLLFCMEVVSLRATLGFVIIAPAVLILYTSAMTVICKVPSWITAFCLTQWSFDNSTNVNLIKIGANLFTKSNFIFFSPPPYFVSFSFAEHSTEAAVEIPNESLIVIWVQIREAHLAAQHEGPLCFCRPKR